MTEGGWPGVARTARGLAALLKFKTRERGFDPMSIVILEDKRAKIAQGLTRRNPRRLDCQGESEVVPIDKSRMPPEEIRRYEIWQCMARIRHESRRLSDEFKGRSETAEFLRDLANEIEVMP